MRKTLVLTLILMFLVAPKADANHFGLAFQSISPNWHFGSDVGVGSASTSGYVSAIVRDASGNTYLGGIFTSFNGSAVGNIVKLKPDGT